MKRGTKAKIALLSFGLLLLLVGLYLIAAYDGWQQALGAFMLIWSHNIDKHNIDKN